MPVHVIGRRTGAGGSAVIPTATRKLAIVGATRGKDTLLSNEAVVAGITRVDALAESDVHSVVRVSNSTGMTFETYTQNIDFTLTGSSIDWSSAPTLPAPEVESAVQATTTGGSWSVSGTSIAFIVTAKDQEGTGETTSGSSVAYTAVTSSETITVSWAKVPFAGGYNIYLSGGTGTTLIGTVVGAATTTYTATGDTGTATGTPESNTTTKRPASGQTYYVTYYYPVYSYTAEEFTNLADLQAVHGVGSDLTNAARFAFDGGASNIVAVAPSGTTVAHYQLAIDQLKSWKVQYVVALKSGTAIEQYVRVHCEYCSQDDIGLERFGLVAVASGTTVTNCVTWLGTFGGSRRIMAFVPNSSAYYANMYQLSTGLFVDGPYAVPHYFYAAAQGGLICGLADSATPLTNALVNGWTWPKTQTLWVDVEVKDTIEAAGGTYILSENRTPVVYHGITNDTSSVENQELSVLAAEDEMRDAVRTVLSGFRGIDRKITPTRLTAIATRVAQALSAKIKAGIIQSRGEITVSQDADLPTKLWIKFNYTPIYPMNELIFEYGFATAPLSAAA